MSLEIGSPNDDGDFLCIDCRERTHMSVSIDWRCPDCHDRYLADRFQRERRDRARKNKRTRYEQERKDRKKKSEHRAKKAKKHLPDETIQEFTREATSGSYDDLLATAMRWVEVD